MPVTIRIRLHELISFRATIVHPYPFSFVISVVFSSLLLVAIATYASYLLISSNVLRHHTAMLRLMFFCYCSHS